MSMKKIICLSMAAAIVGFSGNVMPAASGDAKETTLDSPSHIFKLSYSNSEDHPYYPGLALFKKELERLSGGKMQIQIYPNAQLADDRAACEGVAMGTIEMALVTNSPLGNFERSLFMFDLPFMFETREIAHKSLDGEFGRKVLDRLEKSMIKGLSFWESGYINMWTNKKAIKDPKDMSGLTIRVMESEVHMALMQALNANPVPMPFTETYTALQNGTVDGATVSAASGYTTNMFDVAPYYSEVRMIYAPMIIIMNLSLYNSLPDQYKTWIDQAVAAGRDVERKAMHEQESYYKEQMAAKGSTITTFTVEEQKPWVDAVKDKVWKKFIGSMISEEDIKLLEETKKQ